MSFLIHNYVSAAAPAEKTCKGNTANWCYRNRRAQLLRCSTTSPTSAPKCSNSSAHSTNTVTVQRVVSAAVSTAGWVTSSVAMRQRCRPPCCAQYRNNKHPVQFLYFTLHYLCLSTTVRILCNPGTVTTLGHTQPPSSWTDPQRKPCSQDNTAHKARSKVLYRI